MASLLLKQLLRALSECPFPNVTQLTFKGFHLLETKVAETDLGGTFLYIYPSRFGQFDFTGTLYVDERRAFGGYDCPVPEFDADVLRNS